MKKSDLRKVIREIIERELSSEMFPIRNTEFEEEEPIDELVVGSDKTVYYNKNMVKNWINFGLQNNWIDRDSKQITDWVKILGSKNIQLEMNKVHLKHNKKDEYEHYNKVSGTLMNTKQLSDIIDNDYLK
tara:strand:+ start:1499 stop:1888 length:390 start_codon:yes stop_codon:yes gene_type:complete